VRRLVSDLAAYAAELWGTLVRGWNAFFFTPADPTALGLIRVTVGLLLLYSMGVFGLDLRAYFGSDGWADPEVLIRVVHPEQAPYAWSFWLGVPDNLLWPAWVGCMLVLALYTMGLFSRVTAVLAWAIAVSTARRVPVALFGFDQIVATWAFYLALTGASGQAVSLDRLLWRYRQARAALARRRPDGRWTVPPGAPIPTVSANLALRLIQLHLCLIYGMAGLAKLQGQGWWSGMAIWGVLASAEFRQIDFNWLVLYPGLMNLMTHASLALELSYPVLIWARPIRPLVFAAVVFLHLGIALAAPGLAVFGIAMIAGNLAFVSGSWLRSLVTGRVQPAGRVLYDGACPRCRASMVWITAGDPDRVIEPVDLTAVEVTAIHPSLTPKACLQAMHVVRANGRVDVGFDAVLTLGRWVPLFWPLAMVGSLPVFSRVGHRVYNAIAESRPRDVPCNDDVCGLHPASATADRERARS
jgi:predicted DCC family thiol-disulfide oxidoreductase YuxK